METKMKKILLGTSALIAMSSVAFAGEAPKMSISGSAAVFIDVQSANAKDKTSGVKSGASGNDTGHDIIQPGWMNEIKFSGKGKTDAGLTYGAYVELRPIGAAASDEAGISFGGDWGTLELGNVDGINHNTYITGSDYNGSSSGGPDNIGSAAGSGKAISLDGLNGDDNKITYTAPSIGGVSGGISYTPQDKSKNDSTNNIKNKEQNSVVTVALTYGAKIGDGSVNLAAYTQRGTADTKTNRSWSAYHVGGSVGFGAITAALGYFNNGRGGIAKTGLTDGDKSENGKTIDFGVSVALGGGTTVGASVTKGSVSTNKSAVGSKTKNATETWYSVGMTTPIADGANLVASVDYDNGDTGAANGYGKSNTTQVLVGTRISF